MNELRNLPIDKVHPNPDQPRKTFEKVALAELTDSVRSLGVLEPIVVRPAAGGYQIVAGERRWRAATEAGLDTIPGIVRELSDHDAFIVSMVENTLRADMNPVEEANGYQRLIDAGMTVEELSTQTGKTARSIQTALSLLKLDVPIRELVQLGHLNAWDGSRLATLGINGQHRALKLIQDNGLTGNDRDRVIGQLWVAERQPDLFGDAVPEAPSERRQKGKVLRNDIEAAARMLGRAAEMAGDAEVDDYTMELVEALVRYTASLARTTRGARAARLVSEQLQAIPA